MQAIHNSSERWRSASALFQRAKIQDKCKQFTTLGEMPSIRHKLFQRAKIQDKCKQFTTTSRWCRWRPRLFQRAKIQDKCKQFTTFHFTLATIRRCFKEQRYKINASNSQPLLRGSHFTPSFLAMLLGRASLCRTMFMVLYLA